MWFLTGETYAPGPWYGNLIKYENGRWKTFAANFKNVTAAYEPYEKILYVLRPGQGERFEGAITGDGGISWVTEKFKLPSFPGTEAVRATILPPCYYRGDLYFAASPDTGGHTWTAVYRREGPPGAPTITLSYFSNYGPSFMILNELAGRDDGTLMGVGTDTNIIYDGSVWRQTLLPYPHTTFNALTAGEDGFYATAFNETTGSLELLYYP